MPDEPLGGEPLPLFPADDMDGPPVDEPGPIDQDEPEAPTLPDSSAVDRLFVSPEPAVEPTAAEPAPPVDVAGLVNDLAARIERRLDALQTLFDREIRAEATREKVVDRLHAELQEYKQDLLLNTLRPVFVDLIQLHDDIGKVAVASVDSPEEVRRLVGLMQGFQQGIEDILYRQGVEPFEAEGDAFDARRQRAVATVATDDPSRNKAVAARLRKGFRAGDRVIRPEVVSVYAYKPE